MLKNISLLVSARIKKLYLRGLHSIKFGVMKYCTKVLWVLLLMVFGVGELVNAQVGKEFWFAAPDVTSSHGDAPVGFRITAGATAATVRISQPANASFNPFTFTVNAYQQVTRQTNVGTYTKDIVENSPINQVNNKGILVEVISGGDITCYYEVLRSNNPDIFTLKGENSLGREFFVPSQNTCPNHPYTNASETQPREQINIVATQDNTHIHIVPSDDLLNSYDKGVGFDITLNRGQSYSMAARDWSTPSRSLGGTYITSDQDIAVTSSDDSIDEFPGASAHDLIGDQLVPTSIIGTEYIAMRATGVNNSNLNRVFVTATKDNTIVNATGFPPKTLQKGEVWGFDFVNTTMNSMYITSNEPIYANQLAGILNISANELGSGLLPTVQGCTGSKRVSFTRNFNKSFWVQILTKQANVSSFEMYNDNSTLQNAMTTTLNTAGNWHQVGSSDWYTLSINMQNAPFNLSTANSYSITNTKGLFHLSVLDENDGSMSYGYYSSYNSVKIEGATQACVGNDIVLTAKDLGGTYTWTSSLTGSTILSSTNSLTVTKEAQYYLTRDEKVGCVAIDTIDVVFNQPDFIVPQPGNVCPNTPLTLKVTPATGNTYAWYDGTNIVSITDSLVYIPIAGQTKEFFIKATATDNCSRIDTTKIIAINAPQVSLSSVSASVCVGDTIRSNSILPHYKWSFYNNPMPAYDDKPYIIATADGTYSVVGTSMDGCQSTDSKTIKVNTLPVVDITDQTVCYNTPANYTVPVTSDVVYTWENPTSGIVGTSYSKVFSTTNPDQVWVNATQTYTTATGTSTCSAKDSAMVTWRPEQTVAMSFSIGGAAAQPALDEIYTCTEAPVTLSAPAGFSIYSWKVGSDAPVSGPAIYTQQVTVAAGSSVVVTLTVTDGNNCTATDMVTVRGRPITTVVTDMSEICLGEVATVTTALNSYEWKFGGVVIPGAASNSYTTTVAGTYVVSGRDNNNCLTASASVTVNPLPAFALTGTPPCEGSAFVYGASIGSAGTHNYLWSQVDNPVTSIATTYPVTEAKEVTLELSNTVTGCKSTQKGTPTWKPLPTVNLSYVNSLGQTVNSSTGTICPGVSTKLTGTASAGGGGPYTYAWYVNGLLVNGETSSDLNFQLPNSTSTSITTNIKVVVSSNGCTASDDITLTVLPDPYEVLLKPLSENICLGSSLSVESIRSSIAAPSWSFGGAPLPSLYEFIPKNGGVYHLDITTLQGCTASEDFTVNDPTVAINSPSVVEACSNTNRTFTVTPVKAGYNYVWSNNLNATTTMGSSYTATKPGVYTVTATHATLGCVDAESVQYKWAVDTLLSIGNTLSVCSNAAIDLTATSTLLNYKWTSSATGGASLSTVNTYTIPAGTPDNTVFTVTANYVNGALTCPISQSFNYKVLTVLPALTLDLALCAPNKVCLCQGDTVKLEANNGFVTYQWYEIISGIETLIVGQNSKTLIVTGSGDYEYMLKATQSNTCAAQGNVNVSITPLPVLNLAPDAPVVCEGDPFFINNDKENLSAPYKYDYEWTKNTDPTIHTSWPITGIGYEKITYNIIAKDKTRPECRVSGQQEINSPVAPTIVLQDQSICSSSDYDLSTQFDNSTIPGATHSWSYGGLPLGSTSVVDPGKYDLSVDVVDVGMGITCTYNESLNLKVVLVPDLSGINEKTKTCFGTPAILDATGNYYNYQWSYYGNSYSNPVDGTKTYPNERTIETSDEGFYRVTAWVRDGISCSSTSSDTIELIVNDLPVLSVDLNPATPIYLCSGSSLNLVASNAAGLTTTYSWSNGTIGATNTVFSSGNYEVTGVDSKGCVGKAVENVIDYLPTDVVLAPFTPICKGQSFTLPSITGVAAYQWLDNNIAIPSPYIVTPIKTTVYVLNYLTEANGCWIQKEFTVTVLPVPDILLKAPDPTAKFCDGQTFTFEVDSKGVSYSYEWSRLASGGNPELLVGNAKDYTSEITGYYRVIASTNEGCTTRDSAEVVFNSNPIVSLGLDFPWCPDSTFTLAVQNPVGLSGYVWSPSEVDNGKSSTTATKGGEYSVTAYNANGCSTTDYIEVTIHPKTSVEIPAIAPVCDNANITLISPLSVPSQLNKYQWFYGSIGNSKDPDNPSNPSKENIPWTVTAAGEYFLRVTDLNGCIASNSLDLAVIQAPQFDLGNDRDGCVNDSLKITSQNSYIRYMWNNDPTDNKYFKEVVDPSVDKYILLVEDRNGCIAVDSVRYYAYPLPVPNLGLDVVKCPDFTTLTPAGGPYNSVLWSTGDRSLSLVATEGLYSVEVIDSKGCVGLDEIKIDWLPNPFPFLGNDTLICQTEELLLDAGSGYLNYSWHTGSNAQTIYAQMVDTVNMVTVEDNMGCIGWDTKLVYRTPSPEYIISPDTAVCANYTYILDAGTDYPFVQWSTGETTQTIEVSTPGDYWIEATDGCVAVQDTVNVQFYETPVILALDTMIYAQIKVIADGGLKPYLYRLNNGNLQNSNAFKYLSNGTYEAYVEDIHLCWDTATVSITSVLDIDIPNFFTPNDDGYNDSWVVNGLQERFPDANIIIYDRYNRQIIRLKGDGDGWDGTYLGKDMPSDDYWFVIDLVHVNKTLKGNITLKR